uniref:CUB domain-containing protein n=1 Tax=Caenorhabditis tropicalis TaxID=1561998 RepID=A0A1I7UIK1_9PELO
MTVSIDEVSVENFHDFVRIYEGNSTTGKLLKSITSQVNHQVLNITTKTVLIVFLTDQSITDRGFHITVKARVVPDDPSMGYGTWTVIRIVGIILIILCLLIIYTRPWIQKRRDQNKTEQQPKPPQEEEPTNLFAD